MSDGDAEPVESAEGMPGTSAADADAEPNRPDPTPPRTGRVPYPDELRDGYGLEAEEVRAYYEYRQTCEAHHQRLESEAAVGLLTAFGAIVAAAYLTDLLGWSP